MGERARLTVPQQTNRAEVERLLAEKRSWIEEQRRRQVTMRFPRSSER